MRFTLKEFFPIVEGIGRDLHDWLDVIMDIAEEGGNFDSELHKLIAAAQHTMAAGDVPTSPNSITYPGNDYYDKLHQHYVAHGETMKVPKDFAIFDFINGKYTGSELDPKKKIGWHRYDAHLNLTALIEDIADPHADHPRWKAIKSRSAQIMTHCDEIEKLAKENYSSGEDAI